MDYLIIENVAPYDGRYELELAGDQFTTREWGWIKRFADYFPVSLEQGLRRYDAELVCAYAVIALYRAGKIEARDAAQVFERITDAPFGSTVRLEVDTTADEEEATEILPPPQSPSSNENGNSSGPDSPTSSETSAETPARSGILASDSSGSA